VRHSAAFRRHYCCRVCRGKGHAILTVGRYGAGVSERDPGYGGMTVKERLVVAGLLQEWEDAVEAQSP